MQVLPGAGGGVAAWREAAEYAEPVAGGAEYLHAFFRQHETASIGWLAFGEEVSWPSGISSKLADPTAYHARDYLAPPVRLAFADESQSVEYETLWRYPGPGAASSPISWRPAVHLIPAAGELAAYPDNNGTFYGESSGSFYASGLLSSAGASVPVSSTSGLIRYKGRLDRTGGISGSPWRSYFKVWPDGEAEPGWSGSAAFAGALDAWNGFYLAAMRFRHTTYPGAAVQLLEFTISGAVEVWGAGAAGGLVRTIGRGR